MKWDIERASKQIEMAWDSLDSARPDHDKIKERIASVLALAAIIRADVAERQDSRRLNVTDERVKKLK